MYCVFTKTPHLMLKNVKGRLADPDIQKKAASFVNVRTMIFNNYVYFLNRVQSSTSFLFNVLYILFVCFQ